MRREEEEEEEEEEEDAKSREGRGGTAMGEPHAWRGQRAQTSSSRITNVRQKETREIERCRGEGWTISARRARIRIAEARGGDDDAGIRNLFIVENITLIC
jgi:hypothetical protein